jgi:hypothetical protein
MKEGGEFEFYRFATDSFSEGSAPQNPSIPALSLRSAFPEVFASPPVAISGIHSLAET